MEGGGQQGTQMHAGDFAGSGVHQVQLRFLIRSVARNLKGILMCRFYALTFGNLRMYFSMTCFMFLLTAANVLLTFPHKHKILLAGRLQQLHTETRLFVKVLHSDR